MKDKHIKNFLSVILGHIIEHYNVTLYGFYAVIIGKTFFGNQNNALDVFASIAIGCAFKPLGGILFGYIGDKLGRKKALLYSIFWCSIPTLIIGLTPSYSTIGVFAPILLIMCLALQGCCFAGELPSSAVFITENSSETKLGLMGGILLATGFSGALLATISGVVFTSFKIIDWGWRLSFIVGGLLGFVLYIIRSNIKETAAFLKSQEENLLIDIPLVVAFKKYTKSSFVTLILGGCLPVNLYLCTYFFNYVLIEDFQFSPSRVMLINSITILLWIFFFPIMGAISDLIGKRVLMIVSSLVTIVFSYPLFYFIGTSDMSIKKIVVFQAIMAIIGTAYAAPSLTYLATLFPPNVRHSGISFFFNLGQAFLGSTTPLISTFLVTRIGYIAGPAFYLIFTGFLCFLALLVARNCSGADTVLRTKQ